MCGIVGYTGKKKIAPILVEALSKLEYRGYDSAGVALNTSDEMKVFKTMGKLENLKKLLEEQNIYNLEATAGIGHTRWATHGAPSAANAHPHTCTCGKLAIIHNGIIENFKELKSSLAQKYGVQFRSQTDTEAVAHLIAHEYDAVKDLTKAVRNALTQINGAYAICVMHRDIPSTIVVARKNAPILIGLGEGENYIASDVPAIIEYTKRAIYLDDNEIAVVTPMSVEFYNQNGERVEKKAEMLPWEPVALSKAGYKHFMLKEIHEQPSVIRNALSGRLTSPEAPIKLDSLNFNPHEIERIQIIACGTSLHAAIVGKYLIEDLCALPVDIEPSSEYIYRRKIVDPKTLVIGVSQSGETADTITAIRQAKEANSHILIMTNRPDSTMAREADSLFPLDAGIEVSVAATKSYAAQLIAFYLLALHIADTKKSCEVEILSRLKEELMLLPQKIELILSDTSEIKSCARMFANSKDFIFIARGINIATASEGALKLKEISYINATGYPAGELKHGPIAMLDETMPVLAVMMPGKVAQKVMSNCEEAKARNARLIAVSSYIDNRHETLFDCIIKVPDTDEILSPVVTVVPLQLLAYYIAEFLGKDVDQPRNLAKSVTVE